MAESGCLRQPRRPGLGPSVHLRVLLGYGQPLTQTESGEFQPQFVQFRGKLIRQGLRKRRRSTDQPNYGEEEKTHDLLMKIQSRG